MEQRESEGGNAEKLLSLFLPGPCARERAPKAK